MEDDKGNEAHVHGSGQSVNVVISSGGIKWAVIGLLVFVALLLLTNRTSSQASMKADAAVHAAKEASDELRMAQYWIQQAHASCLAKGVYVPDDPFLKASAK